MGEAIKMDIMCPLKILKIKQKKEPWISNHLIELIKDKDYALKRAKIEKGPPLKGHTHWAIWGRLAAQSAFVGRLYHLQLCGYGRRAIAGRWGTTDLYQACLIFYCRLIARQRPSLNDESLGNRVTQWVWPFMD